MATTIAFDDVLFTLNAQSRKWEVNGDELLGDEMATILNNTMDPDGPSGAEPDVGDWAIRQVRSAIKGIEVVQRERLGPDDGDATTVR